MKWAGKLIEALSLKMRIVGKGEKQILP